MENQHKTKIVVIGGGYAGLQAVEHLAKDPHNEIILIDKNPYHFMQTDVYDLIANEYDFAKVTVDLFTFCSGFENDVTFIKADVKQIDFEKDRVITETQRISYDYLVLAVGARTKFFSAVKGLRQYAYGVKALHRALELKQKFEMSLFRKIDKDGVSCTPLNILIAGGGLSGVEIAAQMASFARDFYAQNHFLCRKLNIVLVNATPNILAGLPNYLVDKSQKHLEKLGVKIINDTKVIEVSVTDATLSNGEKLAVDFMIFAGGIEPNHLVHKLTLTKDSGGYITTNEYLQSVDYENLFVIGDCTSVYDKDGKKIAPTADVAEQMGKMCAQNITLHKAKQAMQKHTVQSRGILVALGRGYAAAKLFGFHLSGYGAYLLKKGVERLYAYKLHQRSKKGCCKIFSK